MSSNEEYYLPEPSRWPIIASAGVLTFLMGATLTIHSFGVGPLISLTGLALLIFLFYSWFKSVIEESMSGHYNEKVDRSFRQGMMWFILSEVFFFVSFFGSLFYLREVAMDWLGGTGYLSSTSGLYSGFSGVWPNNGPGNMGGDFTPMGWNGIPLINTIILLTSGVTITFAHWALKKENNASLVKWMWATVALGVLFLGFQAYEYGHAYSEMNLKLTSGVYGSTFYMLTGFHGFHVTLGTIMLIIISIRCQKGHFTPKKHFAFEGVAWYWHFVDVVWLGLFILVYIM
ncbi:MAG: cytochrome c oxidase subunit 3 [Methylococcales bacterium]|jgi:cytochrome c oxidase subunit III|nr:cytochrome c oxidase subunit 3 [Methylococcales bacterium]MBT7410683.1 cytochrome c oxidase subunit 3 [Methylococcales bacterium]